MMNHIKISTIAGAMRIVFTNLALLAVLGVMPVFGATFTVTNLNDSGAGSLRQAIIDAVSGDTIDFSVTGTITLSSTLTIDKNLTISGPGASNLAISGNQSFLVLQVNPGVTISLTGLTIKDGKSSSAGGGIYNQGTLVVANCAVSGNTSGQSGGGIYNVDAALTVISSTFSANSASVGGGGIGNAGAVTMTVLNSTFSGNSAGSGGGINWGGTGTLTVSNSTFWGNSAQAGGGIRNFSTVPVAVKGTLLAGSLSGGNCGGSITSLGYNLSDDSFCPFNSTGDKISTPAGLDPAGLQNDGGPTQTIALLGTSSAVDAIPAPCTDAGGNPITSDQRGVARPQGSACDIGAFELAQGQVAWGLNNNGQLGDGTYTSSNVPVPVLGLSDAVAYAGGSTAFHSLAAKPDGTVWAWGYNFFGQLGNGTNADSNVPVQVSGLAGAVAFAAGGSHSLAVKSDGTVWAWGYNSLGQLGDGTNASSNVPVLISGLSGVIAVAGGGSHSLAVKSDGTVWAWGFNSLGQLGNGTSGIGAGSNIPVQVLNLTGAIAVAAGATNGHSLALKSDGTVWAWGNNVSGQLGDGSYLNSSVPVQVSGLSSVVAITAGADHSLAVKSDGTVWAWGDNTFGQLGNGANTVSNIPVQVSGLTGVIAVAGGSFHSLAVKSDGTAWAWGYNFVGQLGNGTTADSNVPVQVSGLIGPVAIAAGAYHSLAIASSSALPFSSISVKLRTLAGPPPSFTLNSTFTLGASSDGINPVTEAVTLQVGPYQVTIPAGSFQIIQRGSKRGSYSFSGVLDGVSLQVQIAPPAVTHDGWNLKASGVPVDLTGVPSPITVRVIIGDDAGTIFVVANQ